MFIFIIDQDLWARELMNRIMSSDHSLNRNDILKYILLFHDPISVQQCCHFQFDILLLEL
jgi:hypothetical protein